MSESASAAPSSSRKRLVRLGLLLAVVLAVALSQAAILSWVAGHLAPWAAARSGYDLRAERVRTAISSPLLLEKVELTSANGTSLRAERVEVCWTAPWQWLQSPRRWVQKVEVSELAGTAMIERPAVVMSPAQGGVVTSSAPSLALIPQVLDLTSSRLTLRHGPHALMLEGVVGRLDEAAPGDWQAARVTFRRGDWQKEWSNRRAVTGWNSGRLYLADLSLAENVTIDAFSAALVGPPAASLASTMFGGYVQADWALDEAATKLSVNAWNLSLEEADKFLSWPGGLKGRIDAAKLTFNGDPQNPADAQLALRAEVRDFAVGSRAFGEGKLGLSLAGRKLQVDQFLLRQPSNLVDLSGWVEIPAADRPWRETPFQAAWRVEVGDLGALAALAGDRWKISSGGLQAHGSAAGSASDSNGWSSLRAWNLRLRGMTVDWAQADAVSAGRDITLGGIEAWSGVNFLRGEGRVSVAERVSYQGRLELRVREIARYLEPLGRFAPDWAREGGVLLFWEGDGAGAAHSGVASLELVRFTGDLNPVPINANLAATYSPGNIYVSRFLLDRGLFSLSSSLYFGAKGLSVQDIQLFSRRTRLLRGELFLPISLEAVLNRRPWSETIMTSKDVYASVRSEDLELGSLVELFGQETSLRGRVDLRLDASGPWENALVDGYLTVEGLRAKFPALSLPPSRAELTLQVKDVRASVAAKLHPDGAKPVRFTASLPLMGDGPDGGWTMIDGRLPWEMHLAVPSLDLGSFGPKLGGFRFADGKVSGDIKASRTAAEPHLDGMIEWTGGRLEFAQGWGPLVDLQTKVAFAGTQANLETTRATMGEGALDLGGRVDFREMERPVYDLFARGTNLRFFRSEDLLLQGNLELTAKGGADAGSVEGAVDLVGSRVLRQLEIVPQTAPSPQPAEISAPWAFNQPPFAGWKALVRLTSSQPVPVGADQDAGLLRPDFQIEGALGQPLISGSLGIERLRVKVPSGASFNVLGTVRLTADQPWQPLLDLSGVGQAGAFQVTMRASGPLSKGIVALSSAPPLRGSQLVLLLNTGIAPMADALESGSGALLVDPLFGRRSTAPAVADWHPPGPAQEAGFRWNFR
jgi:hypothetical protein